MLLLSNLILEKLALKCQECQCCFTDIIGLMNKAYSELYPKVMNPALVKSILDKMGRDDRYHKTDLAALTFDKLYGQLNEAETNVIKELLGIEPASLGFKGPFVTLDDAPDNLVTIENQSYTKNGQTYNIQPQHLPAQAWEAFKEMKSAIKAAIGSDLLVESGYRSPAHQAIVFLTYLELSKFNINYVASGVALPGYSQHGDPERTASDVLNQDGIPTDDDPALFEKTKEYDWLLANAGRFGFELSYPPGNPDGINVEPWHWRYTGR